MFILPLGDDVNKRSLPVVAIFLILTSCAVYAHQTYLYMEYAKKNTYTVGSGMRKVTRMNPPGLNSAPVKFLYQFGLIPSEVKEGRPLGLLTHMFVHGSFLHLFGNMLLFWVLVGTLEISMGHLQFLGWYFIWGLAAAGLQLLMEPGETRPLVGASGAISGVIGAYFVAYGASTNLKALLFIGPYPMRVDVPTGLWVGLWVAGQFGGLAEAQEHKVGVAYWAHLGGFAAGALTGLLLLRKLRAGVSYDEYGQLQTEHNLEDPNDAAVRAAKERQQEAAFAVAVSRKELSACPFCQGELSDVCKVGDRMYRCPHAQCKRLIYG